MKEIRIKSLWLKNFKGIKDFKVELNGLPSFIRGANASGKTTLVDGFRWLLFDKDSQDRSDFNIKTLDKNGEAFHNLEHTVIAELSVYNSGLIEIRTFQKTYKEKWTKKRGESQETFSGHETLYSMNDLPLKKNEFQDEVARIIDEATFKIITDPFYFSEVVKWQDRRNVLIKISGDVTKDEVISNDAKLKDLHFDFDDIAKQKAALSARRKKLNDELKAIPIRIDECNNGLKKNIDFDKLENDIYVNSSEVESIDAELNKQTTIDPNVEEKRKRMKEVSNKVFELESGLVTEYKKTEFALKDKLNSAQESFHEAERKLRQYESVKRNVESDMNHYETKVMSLRKEYDVKQMESARSLDGEVKSCPSCKRPFSKEDIENKRNEIIRIFNKEKAEALARINNEGKLAKENYEKSAAELKEIEKNIADCNSTLFVLDQNFIEAEKMLNDFREANPGSRLRDYDVTKQCSELLDEKDEIEQELYDLTSSSDIEIKLELRKKKSEIQKNIDDAKEMLQYKKNNEELEARIRGLFAEETKTVKLLQEVEKQQFLADEYTRVQADLLDKKINSKFRYVRFKLFDEQVNGGVAETCEVLIDGVPFRDANKAAKVNAGIDVINSLSDFYGVVAPIWIDNRESITNIIKTSAQVINLVVDPDFAELTQFNYKSTLEEVV